MNGYRAQWLRLLLGGHYRQVAAEYSSLAAKKHLLADISTRGGVHDPAPPQLDALALARHEGRRSLALEILHMAHADPREIEAFMKLQLATQAKEPRHG